MLKLGKNWFVRIVFFVEGTVVQISLAVYMATKLFCDRCKKEIKGLHIRLVARVTLGDLERFSFDLCMECELLVRSFVEYPKDGQWIQKCNLQTEVSTPDRKFKFPIGEELL